MSTPSRDKLASSFQPTIGPALEALSRNRVVERVWAKDHRLWKPDPKEITDRLGWLTLPDHMRQQLDNLQRCVRAAQEMRITDVVLLGMGGSSLGPEVLRTSFKPQKQFPRLWVLDSTVPGWVREVTKAITPSRTLFLVASKSGGTVEVLSLFAHFWKLVAKAKLNRGGDQFVAITDIPDKPFSFGTLARAQAAGDVDSLRAHQRQAIRIQLGTNQASTVDAVSTALTPSRPSRKRTTAKNRRRTSRR
ncbi:MAG: hypothetical protein HP491_14735 [Nitrospira sp.]|nr:hypothetical protein [Nitrospira sp.]